MSAKSPDVIADIVVEDMDLEHEQENSLLNHNVNFTSSIETTLMSTTMTDDVESLSNLSFSLSETERRRLKQYENENNSSAARRVLKDVSVNAKDTRSINGSISCMESSGNMEDSSYTLEESARIIHIEDTLGDISSGDTTITVPEQSNGKYISISTAIAETSYFAKQLVELGRRYWLSTSEVQRYTKGCYWSPDGTCLLIPVHMDGMHVVELPLDLYNSKSVSLDRGLSELQSAVHVPEGGTVYDCAWNPLMNSQDANTCFWIATRQHEPIHMWDAFDGHLRCSYSGYDEVDEVMASISLSFRHDCQKIYAGYKRCIKIFDTNRPGRICDEYGVKFAVSCIAQTSEHPHSITCGNWKGYIQHFDLRCPPNQGPMFTLGGHSAGITQLRYVVDGVGWQLYSGARKCPKLLQWDMRNYKKPVREFHREVNTNQRIQFDLSMEHGAWLVSGDTSGAINIWNQKSKHNTQSIKVPMHDDCCNGIGFHPTLPILASTSGQYHFVTGNNNESLIDPKTHEEVEKQTPIIDYENVLMLTWFGDS